jgi:nucleoside-diphosphate-sugar epimerase
MKVDPRFMTAPNLFCLRATQGEAIEVRSGYPLGLIHVEDAVRALRWAAETADSPGYAQLNAPAEITTIDAIAELVRSQASARELTVEIRRDIGERDVGSPWPMVRSAMTIAGFATRRSIAEGLAETLDHFLVRTQ